jgi:transcriptional regulator with GAF, ATPase, and Fis domain/ActR/RegA family two-component response regulator
MDKKILIVEDESLVAFDLKLILTKAGYKICGIADSVREALEIIEEQKPEMVLLDIFLKGPLTGIDLAKKLTDKNIAFMFLSANFQENILEKAKTTQPYGFLVKPFREKELLIALDVAFYRHRNSMEANLRRDKALEQTFKNITAEKTNWGRKLLKIAESIQPHVPFDYLSIILNNNPYSSFDGISFLRIGFNEYQVIGRDEFLNITRVNSAEHKAMIENSPLTTKTEYFNADEFSKVWQQYPVKKLIANTFHLQSFLNFPLLMSKGEVLTFSFYSRKDDCYTNEHLALLTRLQRTLVASLEGLLSVQDLQSETVGSRTQAPNEPGHKKSTDFERIIGNSHQLLTVQDLVSVVAPLDTSVLILGESGTGKERVAKSIHHLSARCNKPLVIVNCASLPASLIESELFGHEKGAFTGAIERRLGKFELADNGTIFLDEIGEMPMELQVKLLRVLQEQEVERIGGKAPIKINARIIAATNRTLEKEVEEGRFRLDLYYRLYVFPILIPPLRDRIEDILPLANYFIERFSRKNNKSVTGLSPEALDQLYHYHWPGNVRELEHLIERSILLTSSSIIKEVMLPRLFNHNPINNHESPSRLKTIDENAREHILAVLKKCNGKVSGPGGAAEILEVQPTTLHSKIKKLGITKDDIASL